MTGAFFLLSVSITVERISWAWCSFPLQWRSRFSPPTWVGPLLPARNFSLYLVLSSVVVYLDPPYVFCFAPNHLLRIGSLEKFSPRQEAQCRFFLVIDIANWTVSRSGARPRKSFMFFLFLSCTISKALPRYLEGAFSSGGAALQFFFPLFPSARIPARLRAPFV